MSRCVLVLMLLTATSAMAQDTDAGVLAEADPGEAPVMADGGVDAGALPDDVSKRLDSVLAPQVVGEVLATAALGASDLEPIRPGSLSSLITAVQAFNKDGKLAPGVAVELTPWALGAAANVTYEDYVADSSWWKRNLLQSSISLATTSEGEGDEAVVRAAAGLRIRLWDDSDWRTNTDFVTCAKGIKVAIPEPPEPPEHRPGGSGEVIRSGPPAAEGESPIPDPGSGPGSEGIRPGPPASEAYLAAFDKCSEEHRPAWNAGQGAFGLVATMRAPGGNLELSEAERLEAVLGAAFGLGDSMQFIGSLRLSRTFPLKAVGDDPAQPARTLSGAGARLVYRADRFIVNLNTGLGVEHTHSEEHVKGLIGLLLQVKVAEDAWIESNVNADLVGGGAPGALTFGTSLKWTYDLTPKKLKN
ncbi:hypothetical protein ACLESO_13630 [Pyxidicoccus sp. 3LG]